MLSRSFTKSSEKSCFSSAFCCAFSKSFRLAKSSHTPFPHHPVSFLLPCPATIHPLCARLCIVFLPADFQTASGGVSPFLLYNFLCIHQDFIIFVEVFPPIFIFPAVCTVKVPECLPYGIGLFLFFIFRNLETDFIIIMRRNFFPILFSILIQYLLVFVSQFGMVSVLRPSPSHSAFPT